MKKIKIGQLGICHEHAGGIMSTLQKMSDVFDIVGVVDDRNTSAAKLAGNDLPALYNGLNFLSEEELFDIPGLEAVTVEVPNTDLVPTAIRCLKYGLPIHMDKPGGEDLGLFSKLLDGCKERGLPLQMGYMFRDNPAFQFCRKAVKNNWLGDIFELQANMSHNYGGEAYQEYMGKFKGGIMFNLGCHLIDQIVALLGRPEKITPFLKSAPGFPDAIKNNCVTILEYPNATATIRACSLEADGIAHRRFKLCGTKGSVEFSPLERFDGKPLQLSLSLLEDNDEYAAGNHIVDFGVVNDRYEAHLLEFAKMVSGEIQNPYSYEHDLLVQEVLLAASGYKEWSR
jgi:predicted dehydrogenase